MLPGLLLTTSPSSDFPIFHVAMSMSPVRGLVVLRGGPALSEPGVAGAKLPVSVARSFEGVRWWFRSSQSVWLCGCVCRCRNLRLADAGGCVGV